MKFFLKKIFMRFIEEAVYIDHIVVGILCNVFLIVPPSSNVFNGSMNVI